MPCQGCFEQGPGTRCSSFRSLAFCVSSNLARIQKRNSSTSSGACAVLGRPVKKKLHEPRKIKDPCWGSIHANTRAHAGTYNVATHGPRYLHVHICICTNTCKILHVYTYTHTHTRMRAHIYIYLVYTYIYMCVYTDVRVPCAILHMARHSMVRLGNNCDGSAVHSLPKKMITGGLIPELTYDKAWHARGIFCWNNRNAGQPTLSPLPSALRGGDADGMAEILASYQTSLRSHLETQLLLCPSLRSYATAPATTPWPFFIGYKTNSHLQTSSLKQCQGKFSLDHQAQAQAL